MGAPVGVNRILSQAESQDRFLIALSSRQGGDRYSLFSLRIIMRHVEVEK
jgi:hypothetical protein